MERQNLVLNLISAAPLTTSSAATAAAVRDTVTTPEVSRALLSALVPELHSGQWELMTCEVTNIQKHGRKQIAFCRIAYRNRGRGWPKLADLVIKVDTKDNEYGATAMRAIGDLWNAGFCAPARWRVPRPYGYSAERSMLIQGTAPGLAWIDFLTSDPVSLAIVSARAADWLAQLQACTTTAAVADGQYPVAQVVRWHHELATAFPHAAHTLDRVCATLVERLSADTPAPVPSHGDYHLKNVFLTSRVTTVIDFDTFAMREPAYDVGYGIGQALSMSYFRLDSFEAGARAALAFWRRYRRNGPAPWSRVAALIGYTLLKNLHYALCPMQTQRYAMLEEWPALIETLLRHDRPVALEHYGGLRAALLARADAAAEVALQRVELPVRQPSGEAQPALS